MQNKTKYCTTPSYTKVKKVVVVNTVDSTAAGRIKEYKLWAGKRFQLININISPPKISGKIHHCVYLQRTYSDASFFNVAYDS